MRHADRCPISEQPLVVTLMVLRVPSALALIVVFSSGGGGRVEKQFQDRGLGRAGGEEEERECYMYRLVTRKAINPYTDTGDVAVHCNTQKQHTTSFYLLVRPCFWSWYRVVVVAGCTTLPLPAAEGTLRRLAINLCALVKSSASTHYQTNVASNVYSRVPLVTLRNNAARGYPEAVVRCPHISRLSCITVVPSCLFSTEPTPTT